MCTHHRNPLHCILPPYMSDKLNELSGDGTSTADDRFRQKRKLLAAIPPAKKQTSMAAAGTKPTGKIYREVYDAGEMPLALGKLIWKEGQKDIPKSTDAKNVIAGAGNVWTFYKKLFDRNSIDNKDLPLIQTIRYRENPDEPFYNAFWDGEQMFYGTGNKKFTNSFTADLDIIGHELTHGVIDFEAQLAYEFQSGALNESYADVFGILVKQWAKNTPARKADWLIGSNVLKGKNALRSMKAPGTAFQNDPLFGNDPQPATMKGYVTLPNTEKGDYGGVHINSGICNYAFFVTCFELNGNAWEKAGPIWYAALTDKKVLSKHSDFAAAATATLKKAGTLFGKNSLEVKAVEKGWKEAGVI
ncbi:MAG: M4 family metallopeptidase [Chitinophagaceae bacterium]